MGLRVEFSKDENTVTLDGTRYVAVPGDGVCGDCAMKDGFGCRLVNAVIREPDARRTDSALCQPERRKDGQPITWRRK